MYWKLKLRKSNKIASTKSNPKQSWYYHRHYRTSETYKFFSVNLLVIFDYRESNLNFCLSTTNLTNFTSLKWYWLWGTCWAYLHDKMVWTSKILYKVYEPDHTTSFSSFNTAMNASCGTSTLPIDFILFFPSAWPNKRYLLQENNKGYFEDKQQQEPSMNPAKDKVWWDWGVGRSELLRYSDAPNLCQPKCFQKQCKLLYHTYTLFSFLSWSNILWYTDYIYDT